MKPGGWWGNCLWANSYQMCFWNRIVTSFLQTATQKENFRSHLGWRDSNSLSEVAKLPLCTEVIHLDKVKQECRRLKIVTFLSLTRLGLLYRVVKMCLRVLHLESSEKLPSLLISLGNVSWISYGSGILQCPAGHWVECPALQPQVAVLHPSVLWRRRSWLCGAGIAFYVALASHWYFDWNKAERISSCNLLISA